MSPIVDLRPSLLRVRDQGRRASCLAFAASSAHEAHAAAEDHLCVEFLFYHAVSRMPGQDPSRGTSLPAAAAALREDGQPAEAAWPYSTAWVTPWVMPSITAHLHKADLQITDLDFDGVAGKLDKSAPVVLGLVITDAFYRPDALGVVPVRSPDVERGGHAVLAVGYGHDALGNAALLVRNSWGNAWGDAGHAWLMREYVERQLHATAVLA